MNLVRPNRKKGVRVHATTSGIPLCAIKPGAAGASVRAVIVWQSDLGDVTCRCCLKILTPKPKAIDFQI